MERPDITKKVQWAVSLCDRSENADYHYNKKNLGKLTSGCFICANASTTLKVVKYDPNQKRLVMFGAWVEIENESGSNKRLRIACYEELFGEKDYISIDSPITQALYKKEVGDEVMVKTASVQFKRRIKKIEYEKWLQYFSKFSYYLNS